MGGAVSARHTPGPWEYVPSNENHGPYVSGLFGGDIADCYVMSQPSLPSRANGGESKPIHFMGEQADANARLIAAAPDLLAMLQLTQDSVCKAYCVHHSDGDVTHVVECENARAAIAKATGAA